MPLFSLKRQKNQLPPAQGRNRLVRDLSQAGPRSGQNRTFSYAANRSQADFNTGRTAIQNKPQLRHLPSKIQKLRRHFGWLLVAVVVVGLSVYEMQLSPMPKVVSLTQASDAPFLQDSNVYARKAAELFDTSAANRNKLTVDSSNIAIQLRKQFPELQDVSVSLPLLGDQPTIYIRPAAPALVLTAGSSGPAYVVDENGRAVAEAGAGTPLSSLHVPTVTDQSGVPVQVGSQVLPRSATTFITIVVAQLKAQHIQAKSLVLPVAGSELDVYITNQPYFVKFNLHDADEEAAALQAGTYIAVSKQLTKQGKVPSQYIDVRLAGRAYYK